MKTKFLLLIVLAGTIVVSCSDDRDSETEIHQVESIVSSKGKKINNDLVQKQRTISDTIDVSSALKENTSDLSDGGDPKDIPPRR